jgi:predicted GIY-YIG superfamily endonuclease
MTDLHVNITQIDETDDGALNITIERPWYVYLLITNNDEATYVGATIDPDRRLRQHNKEISGGARATGARVGAGLTWRRVCYVQGFPDKQAALQFEWRWKSLSRVRSRAHLKPLERRLDALNALLALTRPTTAAREYSSWSQPPKIIWNNLNRENTHLNIEQLVNVVSND